MTWRCRPAMSGLSPAPQRTCGIGAPWQRSNLNAGRWTVGCGCGAALRSVCGRIEQPNSRAIAASTLGSGMPKPLTSSVRPRHTEDAVLALLVFGCRETQRAHPDALAIRWMPWNRPIKPVEGEGARLSGVALKRDDSGLTFPWSKCVHRPAPLRCLCSYSSDPWAARVVLSSRKALLAFLAPVALPLAATPYCEWPYLSP